VTLTALHDLVADGEVDHDPTPGQVDGAAGFVAFFNEMRAAFPDLHVEVEVEHLVADDDNVAFAYTLTGTHDGPVQGHGTTGKPFAVRGVQISKFDENATLVERWGDTDEAGIMSQLGLA